MKAGCILKDYYDKNISVTFKDKNQYEPVTEADLKVNDFIVNALQSQYKNDKIISEE